MSKGKYFRKSIQGEFEMLSPMKVYTRSEGDYFYGGDGSWVKVVLARRCHESLSSLIPEWQPVTSDQVPKELRALVLLLT